MNKPTPVDRPVGIALLTISDSRTVHTDRSGDLLAGRIADAGHRLVAREILPDDLDRLIERLRTWCADPAIEVILTTGGTGVTGRDVTPEAVEAVADKMIPGFGELFRMLSFASIGPATIQSRACGAVAHGTYLFALPGSPGACQDAWDQILCDQLDSRQKPCNFVQLLGRLEED